MTQLLLPTIPPRPDRRRWRLRCFCGRYLRPPPPLRCACTPEVSPESLVPGARFPVGDDVGGWLTVEDRRGDRVRVRWGMGATSVESAATWAGMLSEPAPERARGRAGR